MTSAMTTSSSPGGLTALVAPATSTPSAASTATEASSAADATTAPSANATAFAEEIAAAIGDLHTPTGPSARTAPTDEPVATASPTVADTASGTATAAEAALASRKEPAADEAAAPPSTSAATTAIDHPSVAAPVAGPGGAATAVEDPARPDREGDDEAERGDRDHPGTNRRPSAPAWSAHPAELATAALLGARMSSAASTAAPSSAADTAETAQAAEPTTASATAPTSGATASATVDAGAALAPAAASATAQPPRATVTPLAGTPEPAVDGTSTSSGHDTGGEIAPSNPMVTASATTTAPATGSTTGTDATTTAPTTTVATTTVAAPEATTAPAVATGAPTTHVVQARAAAEAAPGTEGDGSDPRDGERVRGGRTSATNTSTRDEDAPSATTTPAAAHASPSTESTTTVATAATPAAGASASVGRREARPTTTTTGTTDRAPATANDAATTAAAPTESQGAQAWRQVTNHAQLNRAVDGGVNVRVEHAELGTVEVRAQLEAGGVDVELHTSRAASRDTLHNALPALRAELEATGISTRVLSAHRSELGSGLGHGSNGSAAEQQSTPHDGGPTSTADHAGQGGRGQRHADPQMGEDALGRSIRSTPALTNGASGADATASGRLRTEPTSSDRTGATRLDRRIDLQL